MKFDYFTLSDNHYANNTRTANQFVADILDEGLYAEELGFHSAWIGEHHFNSLGVLSCPDLVLATLAARHPLLQCRPQAPWSGERLDDTVHGRSRTVIQG